MGGNPPRSPRSGKAGATALLIEGKRLPTCDDRRYVAQGVGTVLRGAGFGFAFGVVESLSASWRRNDSSSVLSC